MALSYSQSLLRKFFTLYLMHPEQLTEHERQIAERICTCSLCDTLWIRRKMKTPKRCPRCHKHAWNRPLLEAMKAHDEHAPEKAKEVQP